MELSLIILRCQKGDRRAWGQLYEATRERLLAVCRQYVGDDAVAEDLLHDAYLLIFEHLSELKDLSKASAWMTSVTRNLALLYLRKENALQHRPLDDLCEVADQSSNSAVTYEAIVRAIDELPEGYQRVFRLSVVEGLSHQEIATILHIEPHTSSSQLFRAKSMLRRSLTAVLFGLLAIVLPTAVWHALRQAPSLDGSVASIENRSSSIEKRSSSVEEGGESDDRNERREERGDRYVGNRRERIAEAAQVAVASVRAKEDTIPSTETASLSHEDTALSDETTSSPREDKSLSSPLSSKETPLYSEEMPHSSRKSTDWQLALAYSGQASSSTMSALPYADANVNAPSLDTVSRHRMPVTFGLSVNRMIGRRMAVGLGLQYTQLNSDIRIGNSYGYEETKQRVRYLGIPLRLTYYPVRERWWSLYASANATVELPLRATGDCQSFFGGNMIYSEHVRLSPQTQWSAGLGLGAEYRLTPHVGFYVEPSLQYYFDTMDALSTWRTEHPLSFSLPLGVRVTF